MNSIFRRGSSRSVPTILALPVALVVACDSPPGEKSFPSFPTDAWAVDSSPTLILGDDGADSTKLFSVVFGATRLPDGGIIVADRQQGFTLHFYDETGAFERGVGRPGNGPGEFGYPARFWRCGDSLFVNDIRGYRESAFTLDGTFVRSFSFGAGAQAPSRSTPYRSACNGGAMFAHYGWDATYPARKEGEVLAVRGKVPFWFSVADSSVLATLDSMPGSERAVYTGGSSPLMLGKQTALAMTSDRLYIGTAENAEVFVVSLSDYSTDTLAVPVTPGAVTQADIDALKGIELATTPASRHREVEREFAEHPFPDSLPPYASLVADSEELLWVQDYPRASSELVKWTVVSRDGRLIATVSLPTWLEVYEIGRDYVLGRYLHPVESIPQVHLYHLHRGRSDGR